MKMKKIRSAIFGLSHPHALALYWMLKKHPDDFEIVGFAELPPSDPLTYDDWHKKLINDGIREFADWHRLAEAGLDLAIVTSDNASRGEVCCELLSHGIHVLDEKPMAMTYAEAVQMKECADAHHVKMLTNWPIAWFPTFRAAKRLLDEGRIGKLMRVTYRSPATWGPFSYSSDGSLPPEEKLAESWWYHAERGGGSILDYACYGAMLSTWMFGHSAKRVSCFSKQFTTTFCNVEDYSAMMLDFGNGIGLLEGPWSTYNCGEIPTGPILYGTDGVIVCDRHSRLVKIYEGKSHPSVAPSEVIDAGSDQQERLLGEHLAACLRGETAPDELLDWKLNLAVVAALEAGARSAQNGVAVVTEQYTTNETKGE